MINQKLWVKAHKKEFANSLIVKSGVIADGNPSAIFMAGLPGAGKTEFSKNLIKNSELKVIRLDMDEIATVIDGYEPEKADLFRFGASELLNKTFDIAVRKGYDFIMDGTFSSKYAKNNVKRALAHEYTVKIVYVVQDPKIAWDFTLAREKVERRAISQEGFIDSYFNTISNIKDIMSTGYEKISLDIILKDKNNKTGIWKKNVDIQEIDKSIKNNYNKESLKEYING